MKALLLLANSRLAASVDSMLPAVRSDSSMNESSPLRIRPTVLFPGPTQRQIRTAIQERVATTTMARASPGGTAYQAGFQLSGWKSLMDRHSRWPVLKRPFGVNIITEGGCKG